MKFFQKNYGIPHSDTTNLRQDFPFLTHFFSFYSSRVSRFNVPRCFRSEILLKNIISVHKCHKCDMICDMKTEFTGFPLVYIKLWFL